MPLRGRHRAVPLSVLATQGGVCNTVDASRESVGANRTLVPVRLGRLEGQEVGARLPDPNDNERVRFACQLRRILAAPSAGDEPARLLTSE
jgi:hypothetical protein